MGRGNESGPFGGFLSHIPIQGRRNGRIGRHPLCSSGRIGSETTGIWSDGECHAPSLRRERCSGITPQGDNASAG